MSDNLDNALAEIINKAASGVDDAMIFISGQMPDVVSQVLFFELTWNVFMCLVCAFVFSLSILLTKKGYNQCFSVDDLNAIAFVFGAIFSVVYFFAFIAYIKDVLKIWLAPKIFLLEYAADLVK